MTRYRISLIPAQLSACGSSTTTACGRAGASLPTATRTWRSSPTSSKGRSSTRTARAEAASSGRERSSSRGPAPACGTASSTTRSRSPVHFLQIWIVPDTRGLAPTYGQLSFDREAARRGLVRLASRDGVGGSLQVQQDVEPWGGLVPAGERRELPLRPSRHAWVHVARGAASVNGTALQKATGSRSAARRRRRCWSSTWAEAISPSSGAARSRRPAGPGSARPGRLPGPPWGRSGPCRLRSSRWRPPPGCPAPSRT